MEVKVRVLKNEKEIQNALQENQKKANQRIQENTKKKADRIEILPDVEVPERDIELKAMLIDASKVDMITESSVDETYEIMYLGKGFQIVEDKLVWAKVKDSLEKRESNFKVCG